MELELSEEIYSRLANHAVGFETPNQVIEKLLDFYEGRKSITKPEIEFLPSEEQFKRLLLDKREAWKIFDYVDGRREIERWVASRFTEKSNLRANLWSGSLRDWQVKGIKKFTLSIDKPDSLNVAHGLSDDSVINIKVGRFIQQHLDKVVEYCNEHPEHVKELMDLDWSQNHLGLSSYAFLALSSSISSADSVRYWKPEFSIKSLRYRFCSQFGGSILVGSSTKSEYQGKLFRRYLKAKNLLMSDYSDREVKFVVG